jgi:hypothetical protein
MNLDSNIEKHMTNKWKQGEHVVIVGDTGTGKTYLESKILTMRKHIIYMQSKTDDIKFPGFRKVKTQLDIGRNPFENGAAVTKWLLQPKLIDFGAQQKEFSRTFDQAWREGGWTIVIDETYFATYILKLEKQINMLLTQGRSKHLTIVVGMQRPAWISRFALSQATHAFIFRCEGRDVKSLADALSPKIVKPVQELTGHDFVYFNRATREVKVGNANKLGDIFG